MIHLKIKTSSYHPQSFTQWPCLSNVEIHFGRHLPSKSDLPTETFPKTSWQYNCFSDIYKSSEQDGKYQYILKEETITVLTKFVSSATSFFAQFILLPSKVGKSPTISTDKKVLIYYFILEQLVPG